MYCTCKTKIQLLGNNNDSRRFEKKKKTIFNKSVKSIQQVYNKYMTLRRSQSHLYGNLKKVTWYRGRQKSERIKSFSNMRIIISKESWIAFSNSCPYIWQVLSVMMVLTPGERIPMIFRKTVLPLMKSCNKLLYKKIYLLNNTCVRIKD